MVRWRSVSHVEIDCAITKLRWLEAQPSLIGRKSPQNGGLVLASALLPMVPALARRVAAAVFLGVLLAPSPFRAQSVTTTSASTRSFTNARLGMTVVGTEIDLPYGRWNVASIAPAGVIDQVYVLPEESAANSPGRRTRSAAANVRHTVMALLRNPTAQTVTLTLADAATTRRMDVRWTLAGGRSDPQLMAEWATARMGEWRALADRVDAATLRTWIARAPGLYGTGAVTTPDFALMAEQDRTFDVFSLLGGRAALRETLQTQLLRPQAAPTRFGAAAVPISTLKGVDVAALPFERLLAGQPGVRLALANSVPGIGCSSTSPSRRRSFRFSTRAAISWPAADPSSRRAPTTTTSRAGTPPPRPRRKREPAVPRIRGSHGSGARRLRFVLHGRHGFHARHARAIRRCRRARPPHARHRRSEGRRHHGQTHDVRAHRVVGPSGRPRLPQHESQGARSDAAAWRPGRGWREPRPQRGVPLHADGAAAQAREPRLRVLLRWLRPAHGQPGAQDRPTAAHARERRHVDDFCRCSALQARRSQGQANARDARQSGLRPAHDSGAELPAA